MSGHGDFPDEQIEDIGGSLKVANLGDCRQFDLDDGEEHHVLSSYSLMWAITPQRPRLIPASHRSA